ncbi:protein-lysine N-methyltransferase SMYD4 isoform X1 [Festucalex cinctus]
MVARTLGEFICKHWTGQSKGTFGQTDIKNQQTDFQSVLLHISNPTESPVNQPSSGGDHSCALCGGSWSGGELSEMLRDIRRDLDAAGHLLEKDKPSEAAALLERSRTRRRVGVTLTPTHELCGHTEDTLARAHAAKGDWSRAAGHLERSAAAVAARFGADSVEMARQVAKLAQLHFNAGSREAALSVIPEARRLLSLHCGALCPEVQELQAMEDCLRY